MMIVRVLLICVGMAAVAAAWVVGARRGAHEQAAAAAVATMHEPTSLRDLEGALAESTKQLDVVRMQRLEIALLSVMPPGDEAADVHVKIADAASLRALEAAVRARTLVNDPLAAQELDEALARAEASLAASGSSAPIARVIGDRMSMARADEPLGQNPMLLMPTYPDEQTRLVALSRPLWDPNVKDASLTTGDVEQLAEELRQAQVEGPLTRSIQALAEFRLGHAETALLTIEKVLRKNPSQPLAMALRAAFGRHPTLADADLAGADAHDAAPAVPTPTVTTAKAPVGDEPPPVARAIPAPTEAKAAPQAPEHMRPSPAVPTASERFDVLLEEGCRLVDAGDAAEGLTQLRRAHDQRPGDVAVTVCLAKGYRRLGRRASALAMCDRVLDKVPTHEPALRLAASLAMEDGNMAAVIGYNRTLLRLRPHDEKLRAFLQENGALPPELRQAATPQGP